MARLFYDLLLFGVATALYGGGGWLAWRFVGGHLPPVLNVAVSVVLTTLGAIAATGLITLLLPRLRPGRHEFMKSTVFWSWVLRSLFRRALLLGPMKPVIFTSNVLRFLALRALGAKVAYDSDCSSDVDLLDPALLRVGRKSILGARTLISGHYVDAGKLVLGEIVIGEGTLLAVDVLVAPDNVIGDRCRILGRAGLGPGCRIEDGAVLGAEATLEGGTTVRAGVAVPPGVFVRKHVAIDAETAASLAETEERRPRGVAGAPGDDEDPVAGPRALP